MPTKHKFTNDRIVIDQLRLKCVCGPDAFGRRKPQPVSLSVELATNIARAAASDRVQLSVDYSEFVKRLNRLGEDSFEEVRTLLERVVKIGLEDERVGRVYVKAELEKGSLGAERVIWEQSSYWEGNIQRDTLDCRVEGIHVPIIIGIEENAHERTQKQPVLLDLGWMGHQKSAESTPNWDLRGIVNSVISVPLQLASLTVESLNDLLSIS